jgi:hypothetical protein
MFGGSASCVSPIETAGWYGMFEFKLLQMHPDISLSTARRVQFSVRLQPNSTPHISQ